MVRLRPDYQLRKPARFALLRGLAPYLILLIIFSFFLSSLALLRHFRSPAVKQKIGWQSWDTVRVNYEDKVVTDEDGNELLPMPSMPLDTWDPLLPHDTGITEIAIRKCYFPPWLTPSYCAPPTTPELDKTKGKWVIVERDLNMQTGLWYLNVYYRRTRRLDADLIVDLLILPEPPSAAQVAVLDGWTKAEGDLHSGVWPKQPELRLWYKTDKQNVPDYKAGGGLKRATENFITDLDVVYGDGPPFYGFKRIEGPKVMEAKAQKWDSVGLAYKRGIPWFEPVFPPSFHADGTLKIMQIADLHYSVGTGECKDTDKTPCEGDADTAAFLGEALDAEKPDMVVFSGDQLNGDETAYDVRSVVAKFAQPVIDRKIPWTAIFGNHDSPDETVRKYHMRLLRHMPYCLARDGPDNVDGVGNYFLTLHSNDASQIHLFTLYFLDSHAYQKKTLPWAESTYDYLKESQIEYFLNISSTIAPIERPFTPDGAEDLGHIWARSRAPRAVRQVKTLAKPNAMMFFHIPLPETFGKPDFDTYTGEPLELGSEHDIPGASPHNGGFFYNAVKASFENDGASTRINEVKILAHGHSHITDVCRRIDGIWICFDGGSSYSAYGLTGFDRRVRIYQVSEYGEKVETYKRLTTGNIIDRQVLVGNGAAAGVGMSS